jgi:hypothetical protein
VTTSVVAGTNAVSLSSVAAVAVDCDPFSVIWTSASDHSVTLDLTGSSFSVSTTGLGTTALAASDFQVAYVDGATDPDTTAQPSTAILAVALGVVSADGDPASAFGFLMSYTGGGAITDGMGGMGVAQVGADIGSVLTAMPDGSYAIVGPYSITFDASGSSSQGVFFLDNYNYGVSAVPAPSSLALYGLGAVAVAAITRRRRSELA